MLALTQLYVLVLTLIFNFYIHLEEKKHSLVRALARRAFFSVAEGVVRA